MSTVQRQDTDEAHVSDRGTHVAMTSLLWLPTSLQFLQAGSCASYSVPAGKVSLSSSEDFSTSEPSGPELLAVTIRVHFPKIYALITLIGLPAFLTANRLRQM